MGGRIECKRAIQCGCSEWWWNLSIRYRWCDLILNDHDGTDMFGKPGAGKVTDGWWSTPKTPARHRGGGKQGEDPEAEKSRSPRTKAVG